MDVFVTGGSGYVGSYVVPALRQRGHRVFAIARSDASARRVSSLGAEVVSGDLSQRGEWLASARRADAIVHLASPPPGTGRRFYEVSPFSKGWVQTLAALEHKVLPLLIEAARDNSRCRALVTTTGPAAAGHHGEAWVDEDAGGPVSIFGAVQREIERFTLAAAEQGLPATVLRPGAVYGPDGGFASRMLRLALAGQVRYVGDGLNYLSWIHIDDYARAYSHAIEGGSAGKVVAVVDDEPVRVKDAMAQLSALAGATRVQRVPRWLARIAAGPVVAGWATQSARVRNQRAKALLGWTPQFPTIREGFPDVLARFRRGADDPEHRPQVAEREKGALER